LLYYLIDTVLARPSEDEPIIEVITPELPSSLPIATKS